MLQYLTLLEIYRAKSNIHKQMMVCRIEKEL
jgi:hypothetical protein